MKTTGGPIRCPFCLYELNDRTRKLHVCTAPQIFSGRKNQVDDDFESDDSRRRSQQLVDLEKGHGAGDDNVAEHLTGNSWGHFVQSDVESSGTDLRHYKRKQRRLQEADDLKKGREGVGSDVRNGGQSSGTKNAHQDQRRQEENLDLQKGGEIRGSANAPARGFLQRFWPKPGRLVDTAFEGGTNALDATGVPGIADVTVNVKTRKQILDNERRKGSTQKESGRQYNEEMTILRKAEIERTKQWDTRRKMNARKTWEGSRSTEEESERQCDEIERRKQRDIRRKINARKTWEGSSETESEWQHDAEEIAILRRGENERRKQRDARKNRNARKTCERQLGYEVRAKGIMDWLNESTEMKKQLGRIRRQELNAKRREDLLNERRALTRADIRRELQRESLKKQKKKWQKNIEDLQDERLQLQKRKASVKILWWLSIMVDGVILTCVDFYLEVARGKLYWFLFAGYMLFFFPVVAPNIKEATKTRGASPISRVQSWICEDAMHSCPQSGAAGETVKEGQS